MLSPKQQASCPHLFVFNKQRTRKRSSYVCLESLLRRHTAKLRFLFFKHKRSARTKLRCSALKLQDLFLPRSKHFYRKVFLCVRLHTRGRKTIYACAHFVSPTKYRLFLRVHSPTPPSLPNPQLPSFLLAFKNYKADEDYAARLRWRLAPPVERDYFIDSSHYIVYDYSGYPTFVSEYVATGLGFYFYDRVGAYWKAVHHLYKRAFLPINLLLPICVFETEANYIRRRMNVELFDTDCTRCVAQFLYKSPLWNTCLTLLLTLDRTVKNRVYIDTAGEHVVPTQDLFKHTNTLLSTCDTGWVKQRGSKQTRPKAKKRAIEQKKAARRLAKKLKAENKRKLRFQKKVVRFEKKLNKFILKYNKRRVRFQKKQVFLAKIAAVQARKKLRLQKKQALLAESLTKEKRLWSPARREAYERKKSSIS